APRSGMPTTKGRSRRSAPARNLSPAPHYELDPLPAGEPPPVREDECTHLPLGGAPEAGKPFGGSACRGSPETSRAGRSRAAMPRRGCPAGRPRADDGHPPRTRAALREDRAQVVVEKEGQAAWRFRSNAMAASACEVVRPNHS